MMTQLCVCGVCGGSLGSDGFVLYTSPRAGSKARVVVHAQCVPADAVRESDFAFRVAKKTKGVR
jgi:hypothetical protein